MSSSSNFATFAPYTPPPDDPSHAAPSSSSSRLAGRAWFPNSSYDNTSYQSGGIPTFNTSMTGGTGPVEDETPTNQWETTYGMRVDILAAVAYLFGPISALVVLILETQNDYVRFHAYQSALMSTPLVVIRILASLLQFPPWFRTFFSLTLAAAILFMVFRSYRDATHNSLARYHIPILGPLAEQWLAEE